MFRSKSRNEHAGASRTSRMRPTPSFVVSMVALLVGLSGTAMALPGQNTVNSGDIVDNTIKSVDLKDNQAVRTQDVVDQTLTSDDVADQSLTGNDVAPETLTGSNIAPDSIAAADLAPNSVASSEIADNAVAGSELANIQSTANFVLVGGGAAENGAYITDSVTATCPAGKTLIDGSGYWFNQQSGEELFISGVQENHANQSVTVSGGNDSGVNRYLGAVAHCI